MNCEKCKNKKATVFYADDVGGRHSLCAPCAATLGKISEYDPTDSKKSNVPFNPPPTLTALQMPSASLLFYCTANETEHTSCPYCNTSLELVISTGKAGCPECYTVFSGTLLPTSLTPENASGARMPSSHRATIDRIRSINDLTSKIKIAIESENYELAATLRDEIRRLESPKRT